MVRGLACQHSMYGITATFRWIFNIVQKSQWHPLSCSRYLVSNFKGDGARHKPDQDLFGMACGIRTSVRTVYARSIRHAAIGADADYQARYCNLADWVYYEYDVSSYA